MQEHDWRPIPAVPDSQGDRADLEEPKSEPVKHLTNPTQCPDENSAAHSPPMSVRTATVQSPGPTEGNFTFT